MFFFGCPKIVGLAHFPSLTKLCIMNQKILSLVGVGACPNLEELWVCEGEIEVSGLITVWVYKWYFIHLKKLK